MRDFANKELKLGDKVVLIAPPGYSSRGSLRRGVIIGFTPKMAKIAYKVEGRWWNGTEYTEDPKEVNRESCDIYWVGEPDETYVEPEKVNPIGVIPE